MYQNCDSVVTGAHMAKPLSLRPSDAQPERPTLSQLLAKGEAEHDFKTGQNGEKLNPPRKVVDVVVTGVHSAVDDEANSEISKSTIYRQASKLGVMVLKDVPGYQALEELYQDQAQKAKQNKDRLAVQYLESRIGFTFAHPNRHKTGISVYPWVAAKMDSAAIVAGTSSSQMTVIFVVLGLSTLSGWQGFFDDDLRAFRLHLQRRRASLLGEF